MGDAGECYRDDAAGFRVLKGASVCSGLVVACVEAAVGSLCSEENVL